MPFSRPPSIQDPATTAMNWSPSTILPLLVDIIDTVGVAVERDADVGTQLLTLGQRSGAVEPPSSLMFRPSGSTPI